MMAQTCAQTARQTFPSLLFSTVRNSLFQGFLSGVFPPFLFFEARGKLSSPGPLWQSCAQTARREIIQPTSQCRDHGRERQRDLEEGAAPLSLVEQHALLPLYLNVEDTGPGTAAPSVSTRKSSLI